MDYLDVYLHHPFTMLIAGPSGSSKTEWVKRLIERASIASSPAATKITYFYGEYQEIFGFIKNVNFVQWLAENMIKSFDGSTPQWTIIDDSMTESANFKLVCALLTKGAHHRNISVILIVQNVFVKGSESRNISLNSHYIALFKNPRDQPIASNLARQMFPHKVKKFQKSYKDATNQAFSYLFIDLKPNTREEMRLLTNVLGEKEMIAYQL